MNTGPFFRLDGAVFLVIDHGPDQVGRQEVGGKLDPLELRLDGGGEGLDGEGFGQARDAFEQDMAIGEEPDHQAFDHGFLADDDLPHFHEEQIDKCAFLLDFIVDGSDIVRH